MSTVGSDYHRVLERALHHSQSFLEGLDGAAVGATANPDELRRSLDIPMPDEGLPAERVLDQLVSDVGNGLIGSAGGRFFGWVIGGSTPAALAADWMTSTWDQNAALMACSPAAGVIEEVCGRWLKDVLHLPDEASFALVTGCQMAHTTCLAAARHRVLSKVDWDVNRAGLCGAPPIKILAGDQRHGSIDRSVRLLGLGSDSVIEVASDTQGRLTADRLAAHLGREANGPTIVILQAGDINTGAFDPFEELVALAHESGAWVHVDGAIGLWAAASPAHRHLLQGVAQADSWATDGHKWLNVPYDCGYALVMDCEAHRAAMSYRASYLIHSDEARDQIDWNPEWSRRARGFATYAALRQFGRAGLRDLVSRCCDHAKALVEGIGDLPGVEIMASPIVNQGLVRFLDSRAGASEADHDRRTDELIQSIQNDGGAFFGGTTWRGRRCMRVSVCNWQTEAADVERAVATIRGLLDGLAAERPRDRARELGSV